MSIERKRQRRSRSGCTSSLVSAWYLDQGHQRRISYRTPPRNIQEAPRIVCTTAAVEIGRLNNILKGREDFVNKGNYLNSIANLPVSDIWSMPLVYYEEPVAGWKDP